jgi:pimeloyl-ACP methyl ester carboxylesterase
VIAPNVLSRLLVEPNLREGELIFVGHSLGGLVIKQVLRKTEDAAPENDNARSFVERTRKVAFLATPHVGADFARWGDRLRVLVRPSAATQSLLRNDTHLRDLNLWYRRWARQRGIEHKILFETKPTSLFGMIVKPDSSDPGLSSDPILIDADHIRSQDHQIASIWSTRLFAISLSVRWNTRLPKPSERGGRQKQCFYPPHFHILLSRN